MSEPRTEAGRLFVMRHGTAKTREVLAIEDETRDSIFIALSAAIHEVGKRWYRETGDQADRMLEINSDQIAEAVIAELGTP